MTRQTDTQSSAIRDRLTAVPAADASLAVWQAHIGRWAMDEFGPAPMDVTAVTLLGECQDVIERAVTGDQDAMGPALAGVMVVVLALGARLDVDLGAALQAEQTCNQASSWAENPFGQMRRISDDLDARLTSSLTTHLISQAVTGTQTPPRVARWLVDLGLPFRIAVAALIEAGVAPSEFQAPPPVPRAQP